MALTRRVFIGAACCCVSAVWGCVAADGIAHNTSRARDIASVTPSSIDAKVILVFMPETAQTKEVWTGLCDELAADYRLIAIRVDSTNEVAVIADAISKHRPSGIILMNNPTVEAYRQYQRQNATGSFPPAVIVMTSFLEHRSKTLVQTTGVSYEVPLITVMTNLRKLLILPSERVGVVVRANVRHFVKRQIELASREHIVVVEEVVGERPNSSEVKRAIRRLKQSTDVIWILNDNKLLTSRLIAEAWIPGLDERPWLPTIVGAASLVSARSSFGTFAVLPDHLALGGQAASMMLDIANNNWKIPDKLTIQSPLSTTTTIDLVQANERFILRPDALQQVDRILE
jgi:hypothetical protein